MSDNTPVAEKLRKTRATIVCVLAALGKKKTHRTKLVKLVYLADNRFFESTGRTLTGNAYMWDHYGPNAVGNAIVGEAGELVDRGVIRMSEGASAYGGGAYRYWVDSPEEAWELARNDLDAGEIQVVMEAVREYGSLNVNSIVRESKETRPFANAEQYSVLEMEQSPRARELREALASNRDFMESASAGIREAEDGAWAYEERVEAYPLGPPHVLGELP